MQPTDQEILNRQKVWIVFNYEEIMRGRKKDNRKLPVGPLKKGQDLKILATLGETVKRLRKCAHISQERIADVLGLHQTAVCRVELGQQSLQPWHLQQLSELYNIRVGELLSGQINFWQVAERFGQKPPFSDRYRELAHSKVRELLPLLQFFDTQKGRAYVQRLLREVDLALDFDYLRGPDQPIGVNCYLDLLRHSLKLGMLDEGNLQLMVEETRTEAVQGFLHSLYQTQATPMNLLKTYLLNSHHYDSNFDYSILESGSDAVVLAVKPTEHMAKVSYKDAELGDFLCRYKREYLSQLPAYIGGKPLRVQEKECHFHGAAQCVYTIQLAAPATL